MRAEDKLQVLLVEDSAFYVEIVRQYLGPDPRSSIELRCVGSLSEADAALDPGDVDVVVLDLGLPDGSGTEVITRVRGMAPDVAIVVLTATDDPETGLEALQRGAQDYLVKDQVSPVTLTRSVHYAIERHRLQQQYRYQLSVSADAVIVLDAEGDVRFANAAACDLLGASPRHRSELPGGIPDGGALADVRLESGLTVEGRSVRTAWQGLPASLITLRDVTEKRERDRTIRQLAEAVVQASEAIAITDVDGVTTFVNPAYIALTGRSEEEALGHPADCLAPEHPGSLEIWALLRSGDQWTGRAEFVGPGGVRYWADTSISPILDAAGEPTGYVEIRRDLTDEVQLQEQLANAQKLEAVGQLAAGIAHEINTPIQFVGDNLHFLADGMADLKRLIELYGELTETVRENGSAASEVERIDALAKDIDLEYLLGEIPTATEQSLDGEGRVATIVRAMKDYAHPSDEPIATDLNQAIQSTVTVARHEWKYVAEVVLKLEPDLPLVTCVPGEINQVVLNMLVNAAHAIESAQEGDPQEKGTITIETRSEGDSVEVTVADSGCGIPEEIRNRIFDPFFTTKEVGKGTGQGLSIAHAIVVGNHGGELSVESGPGEGTTFTIQLPCNITPKDGT